jgi:hypothetical protein
MPFARLILLTLLLTLPPAVSAVTSWFKVELIAFAQLDRSAVASELWPDDPGEPDWSRVVGLQPSGTGAGSRPAPFERLSRKDYALGPHMWSLSRERSGVKPLIHRAWVQPVGHREEAAAVYLKSSGSVALDEEDAIERGRIDVPPMEGSVTLSVNRYLHAQVDLLLRRRDRVDPSTGASELRTYRLQAHRRMRSGELHYIDHPAMGVLVMVTTYRLAEPSPKESQSATPAPAARM